MARSSVLPARYEAVWQPQPGPQWEFCQRPEFEVLYGGAKGGGKTEVLLMEGLRQIDNPRYHAVIFRRTYPRLQEIIDRSWLIFPKLGARWRAREHRWVFPSGARYDFRHCQHEEDKYNYQGQEYHYMAFDQLEEFTETQYDFLVMQVRTSDPTIRTYVRASANPGGEGHAWVKRRWIDGKEPYKTYRRKFTLADGRTVELTSCFIPARVWDNKILLEANPGYLAQLMALPENLRRAMLDGDWDVFSGQVFEEFRRDVHVVQPFPVPSWWRRWLANDPGYADHFAWYWLAADEDGNVYVYREYTNEPGERVPYSRQAARVAELSEGEQLDFCVTGMDAFNRHPETGKSIVDYYREGGLDAAFVRPVHGPESRRVRAAALHEYLRWERDGNTGRTTARLRIFENCAKLIETIPMLVADPRDPEAVARNGLEHWFDALTYGLCAWHASRSVEPSREPEPLPWPLRSEREPGSARKEWLRW